MKRKAVTAIAVTALGLFSAIAVARDASFSPLDAKTQSKPVTVPGGTVNVTPSCGSNRSVVSGGFATHADLDSGPVETGARRSGNGWKTSISEYASVNDVNDSITGQSTCAKKVPRISTKSASVMVTNATPNSVKAKCTGGKRAVAGGFKTKYHAANGDYSGVLVFRSSRVGQSSWKVSGIGVSGSDPTKLTAYAYCAAVPKLTFAKASKTINKRGVGGVSHAKATAKCPGHADAVSGGFQSSKGTSTIGPVADVPEVSTLKGSDKWTGQALDEGLAMAPIKWTVYVYCQK